MNWVFLKIEFYRNIEIKILLKFLPKNEQAYFTLVPEVLIGCDLLFFLASWSLKLPLFSSCLPEQLPRYREDRNSHKTNGELMA